MSYSNRVYENIIEVTWVFEQLEKTRDIKPFNVLVEELTTGSDAIKDTIIQIAEDFEKEYPEDYDWNATDTDYLTEIQLYAKEHLVEEFGSDSKKIKIGDTVKVIAATEDASYCDGRKREYIPIGTICTVKEINYNYDGSPYYGLLPVNQIDDGVYFCYLEDEFEKGYLEWVKD